jgi:hypothetical protein
LGIAVLLFVLLSVSCLACGQTSIVAIRTPTQVVLGADSKVNHFARNGPMADTQECKIVQEGSVFFGLAFLASGKSTGFDAEAIASRAARREEPSKKL